MKCATLTTKGLNDVAFQGLEVSDVVLQVGRPDASSVIPFNLRFADALQAAAWKAKGEDLSSDNKIRVPFAEVATTDPVRFIPPRAKSDAALVHLSPIAVRGGQLFYEDNEWEGVVIGSKRRRVKRFYRPFPGAGIDVYTIGTGPNGEPHALVMMLPGASFRVCRIGYRGGLPPENVVTWTGSELRVITPAKYDKNRGKKGYAEAAA